MSSFKDLLTPNAFEFECVQCKETFFIHFDEIIKNDSVICPNCKQSIDSDVSLKLQESIKLLYSVLETNGNDPFSFGPKTGFNLKIRWDNQSLHIPK